MIRLVAAAFGALALACAACSGGGEAGTEAAAREFGSAPTEAASTLSAASSTPATATPLTPDSSTTTAPATLQPPSPTAAPARESSAPLVFLDPGHAADEIGAAAYGVAEKDSNLDMAFRVGALLQQQGVRVLLARSADVRANSGPPVSGFSATRLDLQARIDHANAEGADLFVSLHSNGSANTSERGVEVWYNASRPFAAENRALARTLLETVLTEMRAAGYPTTDRGAKDDACLRQFQGRCFPLFVLGPGRVTTRDEVIRRGGSPEALGFAPGQDSISSRPSQMPGALVELLFVSSPDDAAMLRDPRARDAMARGVANGILRHLAQRGR